LLDGGVHLKAIGPVAFYANKLKAYLLNQAFAQGGAPSVVLVGTVGGFTQQHHAA
jgi:hypothetical protein